jgi:hypothetical protein
MIKTKEWAESYGINTVDSLPPAEEYGEPFKRTAGEVAVRTIILHAVAAAGYGIDRKSLIEWLKNQDLWPHVSPREQEFLLSNKPRKLLSEDQKGAQWLQEAQWALLWTIQKVESLGLPIKTCDTIKIVDEIMPGLGDDVGKFISSAELRPAPELQAEEDRISKLYDAAQQASRRDEMPDDLVYGVLFQRHYAFSWVRSGDEWDEVKTAV